MLVRVETLYYICTVARIGRKAKSIHLSLKPKQIYEKDNEISGICHDGDGTQHMPYGVQ